MTLKQLLKCKVSQYDGTQTKLVSQLNLFHKEFENLDDITFSRWVNGRTTPSRLKTFLLILFFTDNIDERFLCLKKIFRGFKIDKVYLKKLEEKENLLSDSYHNIKNPDNSDTSVEQKELSIGEMMVLLDSVHPQSAIIYKNIIASIEKNQIKSFICSTDNNHIINHFPYILYSNVKDSNIRLLNNSLNIENGYGSILNLMIFTPGYATSMHNFNSMSKNILLSLLKQEYKVISGTKILSFVRHSKTLDFYLINGFYLHDIIYFDNIRYYIAIADAENLLSSRYCLSLLQSD